MHVRRSMFHYEFPDDGTAGSIEPAAPAAEAGAVPPSDPAPAAADTAAGSEGTPSPEAAAPAWANDPAFHDAVADTAQQVAAAMFDRWQQTQQPTAVQPSHQEPQQANPFDPSAFDPFSDQFGTALAGAFQTMEQRVAQAVQQALAPIAQQREQAEQQESQQRVQDMAQAVVAANGDWPVGTDPDARAAANELMLAIATQLAPAEVERWGPGQRAVEAAMTKAHARVMSLLSAAGTHRETTFRNQLSSLGSAPREPAAAGTGYSNPQTAGDEASIARRYAMRSVGG